MTEDSKEVLTATQLPYRWLTRWSFLIVILIFFLSAYFYAPFPYNNNSTPSILHNTNPVFGEVTQKQRKKTILFWTTFFEAKDFEIGTGNKPFRSCLVTSNECQTTCDRNMLNISDAVIFHVRDLNLEDLPSHRLSHQRWIFYLMESPYHTPHILDNLENFFNWTMTYRRDSDVHLSYSIMELGEANRRHKFIPASENQTEIWRKFVQRKRKQVAWFVSNCHTPSEREIYAAELEKHIKVDVFGSCGKLECHDRLQCYEMLEQDYKFYLSFENSICVDYVTEKFYNALLFNTVPIVYGGADYSRLAPNMSYIDVRNYKSAGELAKYLKELDGNDDEYIRYFEWRRNPPGVEALPYVTKPWCSLCEMLHNESLPSRSYQSILSWWFDGGKCGKHNLSLNSSLILEHL